ncbi:MAG: T9SS type A sorting domain-containing protein [Bacteroidales bacterium]|jgi:hypothetical protein|nr:T9SS type A sorting domain-containing protein [Bacteroidales bacterium]
MKSVFRSFILLCLVLPGEFLSASDTIYYEVWDISNLEVIGGHTVTTLGDPQVVSTEIGDAVQFDGVGDRLLVDFNPIMDAKEFTVELVFKPDACYPNNTAPRFLHIQDPDDPEEKRVMIELRIDANNQCYMDGFMKTDAGSLPLIDETLVHSTGVWQHVAITYKDSTFTTYFNGTKELSGTLHYANAIVNTLGKTSLGARMNEVAFFAGLIKTLKVTHACLEPEDFIVPENDDASRIEVPMLHGGIGMDVFPNPADRFLNVKAGPVQCTKNMEISIFDISGKIYLRQANPQHVASLTVDTSGFQDGIYLVVIRSNGRLDYRRIVVLH